MQLDGDKLEAINNIRAEIDAIEVHIVYLVDNNAAKIEVGQYRDAQQRLIDRLDKLMGLY